MTWLPSLYENFYSSMNVSLWYKMGALFSDSRIIYSKVEVLSCLHSNRESHKVKSSFCEADPSRLRRDGFQLESKARLPGRPQCGKVAVYTVSGRTWKCLMSMPSSSHFLIPPCSPYCCRLPSALALSLPSLPLLTRAFSSSLGTSILGFLLIVFL